jgi:hypothetical protein
MLLVQDRVEVALDVEEFTLRLVDFAEGSVEGYFGDYHGLTNQFPTADLAEFAVLNHVWRVEREFGLSPHDMEMLLRKESVAILDKQRRMVRMILFRAPRVCESRLPVALVIDCATGLVVTTARAEEFGC